MSFKCTLQNVQFSTRLTIHNGLPFSQRKTNEFIADTANLTTKKVFPEQVSRPETVRFHLR